MIVIQTTYVCACCMWVHVACLHGYAEAKGQPQVPFLSGHSFCVIGEGFSLA